MEQYNKIPKLKTMTRKRFTKLLMGRFRFSRNEAREITACVQWNKRCSDNTNRSAKYNLSGYREIPESYASNWRRIRWAYIENEKYGGFDYCPSCHTVRPFVVAHHPREMTVRGISFTTEFVHPRDACTQRRRIQLTECVRRSTSLFGD